MSFGKTEKTKPEKKIINRKVVIGALLAVCVAGVVAGVALLRKPSEEEVTYKETAVAKGTMESGVTQRGSIDIGTIEQSFELDMSALQRVNASSGSSSSKSSSSSRSSSGSASFGSGGFDMGSFGGMGGSNSGGSSSGGGMSFGGFSGGMDLFGQASNLAGGNTFTKSSDSSSLTVAEVCVSVGQEVKKGDVLYVLEEESVQELKETLESDVEKAEADLEMLYADQKVSKQSAQNTYEISMAYGSYMKTEYNETISELQENVKDRINLNASASPTGSGIGLGLCRIIAEKHGGTLILESREDEGTDVRVLLPLTQPGVGDLMSAGQAEEPNGGLAVILTELSELLDAEVYADYVPD